MNVFDLSAKITLDINGYLKGMDTAQAIAVSTLSAIGGAIGSFMSDSIEVGKVFDKSMSQVAATLGQSMDEMNGMTEETTTSFGEFNGTLRDFAQYMGKNTAFTAGECADALNYMALAGYDAKKSMEMLPNVLNLAAAGGMDLARASDMVTDTQTAFGITSGRTKQMVDEMAKAASTGNTSVEQLGDAFLVVGALGQELNGGLVTLKDGTQVATDGTQELETALVAMANAGIKGSEAGTHMRNMIMKLTNPTKDGREEIEKMGLSFWDARGKMLPLSDVFGQLSTEMSKMTQQEKIETISKLFNSRDLASAEAIMNAISQDWNNIGAAIQDSAGAAEKMAETQLDNLEGDLTLLNSALDGFRIKLSDAATPLLREFAQEGTKWVGALTDAFDALPDSVQGAIGVIGLFAGQVGNMLPAVGGIVTSLTQMKTAAVLAGDATGGLGGTLLAAAPHVAAVAAAIAAVVAVAITAYNDYEELTKESRELRDASAELHTEIDAVAASLGKLDKTRDKKTDADQKAKDATDAYTAAIKTQKESLEKYNQAAEKWNEVSEFSYYIEKADNTSKAFNKDLSILGNVLNLITAGTYGAAQGIAAAAGEQENYRQAMEDSWLAHEQATAQIDAAQNEMMIYTSLAKEMTEEQKANTEALYNSFSAYQASPEAVESLVTAVDAINEAYYTNTETINQSLRTVEEAEKSLQKEFNDAKAEAWNMLDGMGGVFEEMKLKVEHSVTDITKNIDSQKKYFEDYSANLTWMMGQEMPQKLKEFLASGSKDAVETLAILRTSSEADVKKFVESWDQTDQIKDKISTQMGLVNTDYTRRVHELIDEKDVLIRNLWAEEDAYTAAMDNMKSYMTGMSDYQDNTERVAQNLAGAAASAMNVYGEMQSSAKKSIEGYISVFESRETARKNYEAGFNAAKQIQAGYEAADDSHSPSKVYAQFAKNAMDGLVVGIDTNISEVENAYEKAAETAQDAYNTALGTNPFSVYENPLYGQTDANAGGSRIVFAGDMKIEISGVDGKTADEIVDVIEERIYENARKEQLTYGLA